MPRRPPAGPSLASRFDAAHGQLRTVAVTGTNGKTSTTTFVASIVAQKFPSARVTTLGAVVGGESIPGEGTEEFLRAVERAVDIGAPILAVEMTSKALLAGLASRWRPEVAVFTNLTHDHLDLHETPEAYLAAKAQLFMALREGGVAVLNADDSSCELIAEVIPTGVRILWYGRAEKALLRIEDIQPSDVGQTVVFTSNEHTAALGFDAAPVINLHVGGDFQAHNAAAAILAAGAVGLRADAITEGLADVGRIAGRFELVHEAPKVVVDFAHTPDALRHVLISARRLIDGGQVHCVFGCGGNRDPSKRAPMGLLVDELADVAWLTSDNPRNESPKRIAQGVRAGAKRRAQWHEELDRRQAIRAALAAACPDDIVIIAGKGHEATQEIAGVRHVFDDADEVRAYFGDA